MRTGSSPGTQLGNQRVHVAFEHLHVRGKPPNFILLLGKSCFQLCFTAHLVQFSCVARLLATTNEQKHPPPSTDLAPASLIPPPLPLNLLLIMSELRFDGRYATTRKHATIHSHASDQRRDRDWRRRRSGPRARARLCASRRQSRGQRFGRCAALCLPVEIERNSRASGAGDTKGDKGASRARVCGKAMEFSRTMHL